LTAPLADPGDGAPIPVALNRQPTVTLGRANRHGIGKLAQNGGLRVELWLLRRM
jgi:hypothetical protein